MCRYCLASFPHERENGEDHKGEGGAEEPVVFSVFPNSKPKLGLAQTPGHRHLIHLGHLARLQSQCRLPSSWVCISRVFKGQKGATKRQPNILGGPEKGQTHVAHKRAGANQGRNAWFTR